MRLCKAKDEHTSPCFFIPRHRSPVCCWLYSAAIANAQSESPAQSPAHNPAVHFQADGIGLIDVTQSLLLQNPASDNWVSYNGDYTGRRYSSLTEITPANVEPPRSPSGSFIPAHVSALEVTPVVVAGVMFVTSANDAYALDATTGKQLWHHMRAVTQGLVDDAASASQSRRGRPGHAHLHGDRQRTPALPRRALRQPHLGVAYATGNKNYGATSAPLVVKNKVRHRNLRRRRRRARLSRCLRCANRQRGVALLVHPRPRRVRQRELARRLYQHGGGTTWMPGTYDPELNTLYWGTGNPSPDYDGSVRPGDDLYTSAVVALDPDTGKLKWYFQYRRTTCTTTTPCRRRCSSMPNSRASRASCIVSANRNGFLYILDRTNGKFLFARQFAIAQNWAKGIDENGRPISAGLIPNEKGVARLPQRTAAPPTGTRPATTPRRNMFYFRSQEACAIFKSKTEPFDRGQHLLFDRRARPARQVVKGYINGFSLDKLELAMAQSPDRHATKDGAASCPRQLVCSRTGDAAKLHRRRCAHRQRALALQPRPSDPRVSHELRHQRKAILRCRGRQRRIFLRPSLVLRQPPNCLRHPRSVCSIWTRAANRNFEVTSGSPVTRPVLR